MNKKQNDAATGNRRHSVEISLRSFVLFATTALTLAVGSLWPIGEAQAQRVVDITGAKRTATVNVAIGKSADVRTDISITDITIGDPEVADVNVLTDHSLSILGKKSGTTRVTVYGEGRKVAGIFDVEVSYDTTMLTAEITRRFSHAGIRVSTANGKILLTGTSPDALTLDQAVTVARQFGPDVINSVSVSSPQQVMLEVRFVEASRNASRDLGFQWDVFGSRVAANVGTGLIGGNPFGTLMARFISGGTTADMMIKALEEKGVARSLAEPNLVALSGDTASFLAGGEYPIPVAGSLGAVSVEYKRYGVGLAFTPTVLRGGVINLKIEPEVSQFDPSHTVSVANGINVPALIVRRASTTVELRDGQSFVIGGLLQNTNSNAQEQLPWLGDVPVLGALFRSASYQKNETDLAIIVTPRIVRPIRPGDAVKTPLDNTLPPNDVDLFLLGQSEIPRDAARVAARGILPVHGHILDLQTKGGVVVSVKN